MTDDNDHYRIAYIDGLNGIPKKEMLLQTLQTLHELCEWVISLCRLTT